MPELVPFTTATSQEVKRNFMKIQEEIETVVLGQQKGADVATTANRKETGPPASVEPNQRTAGQVNDQTRHNGQAAPGESLDF